MSRYSLNRRDKKIAGVAATLGEVFNIDPTFIRIGFVAAAIFTSFTWTLIAYAAIGLYLAVQKKKTLTAVNDRKKSDFDRMGEIGLRKPTVHAMVNDLDQTDRRLMAIDHHLHTQNDELAREIEALREDK